MDYELAVALWFVGLSLLGSSFILASVRLYKLRPEFIQKIGHYLIIASMALAVSFASLILGMRIADRHQETYMRGMESVENIWGGNIAQLPASFYQLEKVSQKKYNESLDKHYTEINDIQREIGFQQQWLELDVQSSVREKGLLKYPGYTLAFKGRFVVDNNQNQTDFYYFDFQLPEKAGNITDIQVFEDGEVFQADNNYADGIQWQGRLNGQQRKSFTIIYKAQGTKNFAYLLQEKKIEIKSLYLSMKTDYQEILLAEQAMVPTEKKSDKKIAQWIWQAQNIITGQNIAFNFQIAGNWGELVAKLFFLGPLSIFLFIGLLLIYTNGQASRLHPMHYFFYLTSFFIYYLLCSYLVSFLPVLFAVLIALMVSTSLLVYYTYAIGKHRLLIKIIIGGCLLFQWLFSIAFFFPAYTGLLITLASILAFAALMRASAQVDWQGKF